MLTDQHVRTLSDGRELWLQRMTYGKFRLYVRAPDTPDGLYDNGW